MTVHLTDVLFVASALLSSGVLCAPLMEPSVDSGWSQVVRLRHLYAARTGLHLQISPDGGVHGSEPQNPHTLLEITAVSPGFVAIRGVASDLFLCMHRDAAVYTSAVFSADDCTFREQILADGYSTYSSQSHGQLLSLGTARQRQRGQDRGLPALAQFLPRLSALQPRSELSTAAPGPADHIDTFGRLSQIVHSPSFHER